MLQILPTHQKDFVIPILEFTKYCEKETVNPAINDPKMTNGHLKSIWIILQIAGIKNIESTIDKIIKRTLL